MIVALLVPLTAIASVPFVFTNGQIADASQVNADFAALTPIQGVSHERISLPAGQQFVFPSSPAFTAPRALTCLVTVEAQLIGSTGSSPFLFYPAMKVGTTTTTSGLGNVYFIQGPTMPPDEYFYATSTWVFSGVTSGAPVSFGAEIYPMGSFPPGLLADVTAVYNCT
jgi:hypothetical protein